MEEIPNTTNNEECIELKNIKYKTMLLSGTPIKETKSANNLSNLEKFLENEQNKILLSSKGVNKFLEKTLKTENKIQID